MILGWLEEANNVNVRLPATYWITEVIGLIFVERAKKSIWIQKTYDDTGPHFETEHSV